MKDIREVLEHAIKSEIEAQEHYGALAERVRNPLLKERLLFLKTEEERHERFLRDAFEAKYPGEEPNLPGKSAVPGPAVEVRPGKPLTEILEEAIEAEIAASEFYASWAEKAQDERVKRLLEYLSAMERSHRAILEAERELAAKFEDYEAYDPGFHLGP